MPSRKRTGTPGTSTDRPIPPRMSEHLTPGPPPPHAAVAPVAFLLGTWRGSGEGSYPTIDGFGYVEEITFGHVGKPFLAYAQKTRHVTTDLPLHAESGYLRPVGLGPSGDGSIEFVLAHPTGLLESLAGRFTATDDGGTFELACPTMGTTASAVDVAATERRITVAGDTLTYDVAMAAVGQPLTHHLSATLHRV